jgi:hypothetical protein
MNPRDRTAAIRAELLADDEEPARCDPSCYPCQIARMIAERELHRDAVIEALIADASNPDHARRLDQVNREIRLLEMPLTHQRWRM